MIVNAFHLSFFSSSFFPRLNNDLFSPPFELFQPFTVLFDKASVIAPRMSDKPAPTHDQFEPFIYGDQGLTWELFDCIKWLSRGKHQLAKAYLQRLGDKLAHSQASEEP